MRKHQKLQMAAALVLESFGTDAKLTLTMLVLALRNDSKAIRQAAAELLAGWGTRASAAIPALRQAVRDRDEGVRKMASRALERIKNETRAAMYRAA